MKYYPDPQGVLVLLDASIISIGEDTLFALERIVKSLKNRQPATTTIQDVNTFCEAANIWLEGKLSQLKTYTKDELHASLPMAFSSLFGWSARQSEYISADERQTLTYMHAVGQAFEDLENFATSPNIIDLPMVEKLEKFFESLLVLLVKAYWDFQSMDNVRRAS